MISFYETIQIVVPHHPSFVLSHFLADSTAPYQVSFVTMQQPVIVLVYLSFVEHSLIHFIPVILQELVIHQDMNILDI